MNHSAATGTGRDMMDGNKLKELRELVEFLKANEIAEFDMEQDDLKVRIKFAGEPAVAAAPTGGIDLAQLSRLMASAPAGGAVAAPAHAAAPAVSAAAPAPVEEALHEVKSPIVGTFYESPSPGADPFVKIGDQVEVGQVLCIVEAMKLMNEIEADVAGEVVKRIATSGQPVEYGQPLFAIRAR
ncbi:acetyl-CoA carboxylase biotin carboxyl carrier protein [Edaphobacter aggregans]|uniref:Biotin carboxyl carrier protein of acetyl-CoA carboxylase n=2 Tax=Edaphobacter aggregans TaxID=570835 RepID=A0A3R9QEF7_9BACT|nr:acetyl-CoA carboxylase biotin carboxyl carrier protein [Edaphobacter aggregans]